MEKHLKREDILTYICISNDLSQIQYPVINHDNKEYEQEGTYINIYNEVTFAVQQKLTHAKSTTFQ